MLMQEKMWIIAKLKGYGLILFWSAIGISAKISSINKGQKITKKQALATIFTGVFSGYICSSICDYYKVDSNLKAAFISIAALSGENITAWILGNSKDILNRILQILVKKK